MPRHVGKQIDPSPNTFLPRATPTSGQHPKLVHSACSEFASPHAVGTSTAPALIPPGDLVSAPGLVFSVDSIEGVRQTRPGDYIELRTCD